jgi:hypothetical protein
VPLVQRFNELPAGTARGVIPKLRDHSGT